METQGSQSHQIGMPDNGEQLGICILDYDLISGLSGHLTTGDSLIGSKIMQKPLIDLL